MNAETSTSERRLAKILSGGQTGVDRAALDAAIRLGVPHGGWCPAGRKAEDGVIPDRYALRETFSPEYAERTRRNVADSDGTLIICAGPLTGGTALTVREARRFRKPYAVVNLLLPRNEVDQALVRTGRWLQAKEVRVLNVAGPRASQHPGIGPMAAEFLTRLMQEVRALG